MDPWHALGRVIRKVRSEQGMPSAIKILMVQMVRHNTNCGTKDSFSFDGALPLE
jgi:hypothetical protein